MQDYKKEFPLIKTKIEGLDAKFDLADPAQRKLYFNQKAGDEITKLQEYFEHNTFIAYLLGKKNSGKGTYTKLMMEIFGEDKIAHVSVGDIVRSVYKAIETEEGKNELREYMSKNYRGYMSLDEAIDAFINKSQDKLLPTEFILALVKREIDKMPKKTLFIDGFPRGLDQISYSLYFRSLINYRDDFDLFVGIDVPETVIAARMDGRVVCPVCQVPRHPKLLPTTEIGYDQEKGEFYLMCDNQGCNKAKMISKEGDSAGLESIRARLELDQQLIDKVFELHGVTKILLRNAIPVKFAEESMDEYELTPEFSYVLEPNTQKVKVEQKPWITKNEADEDAYSLMPAAVVLQWIKQLVKVLGL